MGIIKHLVMVSKLWKNYNSSKAYDGYFTEDNKLRKHAIIISSILERHGKKKLQEIEKNCQSTINARGIILEFMRQIIELKKRDGLWILFQE